MRILVVDDERTVRFSLQELLGEEHQVRVAEHAPEALAALEAEPADLVISDLSMPAMDGMQLLEEVRRRHPDVVFVLMTAYGDERKAVEALKAGAYDYVPKPFDNDEIRALVGRVRERLGLVAENRRLRRELGEPVGPLIGSAPAMREVYRMIRRAGPTDATVLVTGESGTGKELVARALHEASGRTAEPFIAVNCSAIPSELVESELFGHARGSFTGAERDRVGVFEAASRGTLFLDEVGDLAESAQAKLLRVLEEEAVTRVGETAARPVDVRVIAATNRPLEILADEGRFREDLLYRLRVVSIALPPLRERREDILPLAVHFVAELAERHGREVREIDPSARRALLAWEWPGNVRELRNALERAVVLAESATIRAADLPGHISGPSALLRPAEAALEGLPYAEAKARAVETFERTFLAAALERHGGNVSETARALGLHRQSLQRMLRRLEEKG